MLGRPLESADTEEPKQVSRDLVSLRHEIWIIAFRVLNVHTQDVHWMAQNGMTIGEKLKLAFDASWTRSMIEEKLRAILLSADDSLREKWLNGACIGMHGISELRVEAGQIIAEIFLQPRLIPDTIVDGVYVFGPTMQG